MACRLCLKLSALLAILVLYLALWSLCEECIFWLAAGSCAASVMGASFLAPACAAGLAF